MSFDDLRAAVARRRLSLNPPLDAREAARFEEAHAIALPESYRRFLVEIGDGGAGPYFGLVALADAIPPEPASLARPFLLTAPTSLRPVEKRSRLEYRVFTSGEDPHDGCLILCSQGCDTADLLVVRGAQAGQVWTSANDGVIHPHKQDFLAWYEEWLDEL